MDNHKGRVDPREIAMLLSEDAQAPNVKVPRFNADIYVIPGVAPAIVQALDDVLDRLVEEGVISSTQSYQLIEMW